MSNYRDPQYYQYNQGKKPDSIESLTEQVDELEKAPPGGTSDYNDLQNKPKINDVELEGNKTQDELHIKGAEPKVEGERLIF